jgi:hypothetical protein
MYVKETGYEGVDSTDSEYGKVAGFVNTEMNFRLHKSEEFLDKMSNYQLPKKDTAPVAKMFPPLFFWIHTPFPRGLYFLFLI